MDSMVERTEQSWTVNINFIQIEKEIKDVPGIVESEWISD